MTNLGAKGDATAYGATAEIMNLVTTFQHTDARLQKVEKATKELVEIQTKMDEKLENIHKLLMKWNITMEASIQKSTKKFFHPPQQTQHDQHPTLTTEKLPFLKKQEVEGIITLHPQPFMNSGQFEQNALGSDNLPFIPPDPNTTTTPQTSITMPISDILYTAISDLNPQATPGVVYTHTTPDNTRLPNSNSSPSEPNSFHLHKPDFVHTKNYQPHTAIHKPPFPTQNNFPIQN
jgi:hypothetical protein